jgi:FkbM family methyltransferase
MGVGHWLDVIRRHPRPARLIAARFLERTGLSPLFTVALDGYRLRFYPTNVTANLWINPAGRVHGLALFKDYCEEGDVAVDVGANVGEVSIILSQGSGPRGRVFAFEPNPRIYQYLLGNLALNRCDNVITANLAVGASSGPVRMSDGKRDDMNRVIEDGAIELPCTTLDTHLPEVDRIAFIKIDVEGSELRVLQGATNTLARTACVNCEMGEDHYRRYGYGMRDLIAHLQQAGFQTYVTTESRELKKIQPSFNEPGGHELVAIRNPDDFVRRTKWRLL